MKQYGMPYQGSKSKIAKDIVTYLPACDNLYDLFCGGCAITHRALENQKFKKVYANDLNPIMPELFARCVSGDIKNEKRWISREDFNKLKFEDGYVACCFSFGNDTATYCYAKELEPWKKALHYARVLKDFSLFEEMGIKTDGTRLDIKANQKGYKAKYIKWYSERYGGNIEKIIASKSLQSLQSLESLERLQSLESLERLQSLESLERLQSLESLERLELSSKDYAEVEIRPNSVIYCDIPYEDTDKYKQVGKFDYKRFYDWASNQKELVIISSYKVSDDRFERIASFNKRALMDVAHIAKENSIKEEGLFISKRQRELYEERIREDGCVLFF